MSLTAILGFGSEVLKRVIPDPEQRAQAELNLAKLSQSGELAKLQSAAGVVTAEAKSEHWLTANWRPLTMLTFVAIIANNYIIYPYLVLFFPEAPKMEIPPDMWGLLKLGLGGYVMGRSGEKMIKHWKEVKE